MGLTAAILPLPLISQAADQAAKAPAPTQASPQSPWFISASVAVKETYDSNVYLQNVTPQANQDSFVTSIIPSVGIAYKPGPAFNASLSYTPEVAFYHAEPSEDYSTHKVSLGLNGKVDMTAWDSANSLVWIDGSDIGPTFAGPAGAPAVGAIPLRDRRDAAIWRDSTKITQTWGDWFLRPNFNFYLHDFQTKHSAAPGYANYVDRHDISVGLDAGYKVLPNTHIVLGYRFGHQDQARLLNSPVEYDNDYQRVLVGLEGKPTSWLTVGFALGPDFRDFGPGVAAGFKDHQTKLYIDGSITLLPSKRDTITFMAKRYEQPAFGGRSVYEDITYDLVWKHKITTKLTGGVGFRAYAGDWEAPTTREDWIYTPSAVASYAFTKQITGELSYSCDHAESVVPNTRGRDFNRHLVSLGFKYVLK